MIRNDTNGPHNWFTALHTTIKYFLIIFCKIEVTSLLPYCFFCRHFLPQNFKYKKLIFSEYVDHSTILTLWHSTAD